MEIQLCIGKESGASSDRLRLLGSSDDAKSGDSRERFVALREGDAGDAAVRPGERAEAELRHLRKENRRLRLKRDIIRKAVALFAKKTL
ncbi:MAG: hypothetical protein GC154_07345 [bacterium]|nr:hypothetical protein [bacterium]